mmetsp:Transcript_11549/g.40383  ORF Transcript_11549/g.40383 Transcript_11549/m.40383 type:complete len:354 (+) Transcript_11549:3368-4429(+)
MRVRPIERGVVDDHLAGRDVERIHGRLLGRRARQAAARRRRLLVRGRLAVLVRGGERGHLGGAEEAVEAVDGDLGLGERVGRHRQHHEREAQLVEHGERGEDDGGRHVTALAAVHGERGDRHDGGRHGDEGAVERFEVRARLDQPHLLVAHRAQRLLEAVLPRVELERADALQDLVGLLHALAGVLDGALAVAAELHHHDALDGDQQHHDDQADERRRADEVDQQRHEAHDLHRARPHVVQRRDGVLEALRVVLHERHDLARRAALPCGRGQSQRLAVHGRRHRGADAQPQPLREIEEVVLGEGLDGLRQHDAGRQDVGAILARQAVGGRHAGDHLLEVREQQREDERGRELR